MLHSVPVLQFRNPRLNLPSTIFNLKSPVPSFSSARNSSATLCLTSSLRSSVRRRCRFVPGWVVGAGEDDRRSSESEGEGLWSEIKEIVMFSGPATGLWVCAPLMRVIDTAVIGQGSSLELAALGNFYLFILGYSYVCPPIKLYRGSQITSNQGQCLKLHSQL